jgi:thiamine kinase-like enzyme
MLTTQTPSAAERRGWQVPSTVELHATLEAALHERFGAPCRVTRLERRRSDYASSFAIEELDVLLADGRQLRLVFKDLSAAALLSAARAAKPDFLRDPLREIEIYREVLPDLDLGTAHCYATVSDESRGRYWLFLEKVQAVELCQVGELDTWRHVARRLAMVHARLADRRDTAHAARRLLRYDADFFRLWADRARRFARAESQAAVGWLLERYEPVIELLASLPVTIVHGDFYASNILVASRRSGIRVCPIDWEMAGIGPGMLDLAALTAGSWTDVEREQIVRAYRDGCAGVASPPAPEVFDRALDCCRLHVAVQWLGWSADWSPPAAHKRDWLAEALQLANRLSG